MKHVEDSAVKIMDAIRAGETFQVQRMNLFGRPVARPELARLGELPDRVAGFWRADTPDYALYSYSTPIAWRAAADAWVVPDVVYSLTTTTHQLIVRGALRTAGVLPEGTGRRVTLIGADHSPYGPRNGGF